MQKRKNIRLMAVLAVLIIITAGTWYLLQTEDKSITEPDLFAMENVSEIDSVVLEQQDDTIILNYRNGDWQLNQIYQADPQRLTVLFAILNQVRAKRPVAEAEEEKIDSLFSQSGVNVKFYEGDKEVNNFTVAGIEQGGVTFFKKDDEAFLVNIPGYRSYLAALFKLEPPEWRDKLIFDEVSWSNLEKVEVNYPDKEDFTIRPEGGYFEVEGLAATDSIKLLDYLDRVSLLAADKFINKQNVNTDSVLNQPPVLHIAISDIRNRPFDLQIYNYKNTLDFIAVKDSVDWMLLKRQKVQPLLKEKEFFAK
ncbi:MAG: DUF4340 domain-containing protein [Candidatus Cyclobacteriaceae bacterium M2_1C_046]